METLLAAARLGDPVAHTASKGWMIAGMIGGAILGAALVVATGGTALIAVAAIAAGAAAGGGLGELLGTMSWAPRHVTGSLITGSPNVFINSRPAMRAHLSQGTCSDHSGPPQIVAQGSSTVFINGQPASRKEDKLTCLGEDGFNTMQQKTGLPGGVGHDIYEQWRTLPDQNSADGQALAQHSRDYYNAIRAGGKN